MALFCEMLNQVQHDSEKETFFEKANKYPKL